MPATPTETPLRQEPPPQQHQQRSADAATAEAAEAATKANLASTEEEQDSVDEELRKAAYHGDVDEAKRLVETCGANLRAKDYQGGTPMHYAALEGHTTCIEYFVDRGGADLVHVTDKVGGTPLPVACFWGLSLIHI